jgi:hypothetical protein
MFVEENAIPVEAIAARLGVSAGEVEAEARALSVFIGEDWAQKPAMSAADAYAIVSGAGRRNLAAAAAQDEWQQARAEWVQARVAFNQQKWQQAYDDARRQGLSNAAAGEAGHEAARDAIAVWDRSHPEPQFESPTAAKPSWFQRAKAKVA